MKESDVDLCERIDAERRVDEAEERGRRKSSRKERAKTRMVVMEKRLRDSSQTKDTEIVWATPSQKRRWRMGKQEQTSHESTKFARIAHKRWHILSRTHRTE